VGLRGIIAKAGAISRRTNRRHGGHHPAIGQAALEGLSSVETAKSPQRPTAAQAGRKRAEGSTALAIGEAEVSEGRSGFGFSDAVSASIFHFASRLPKTKNLTPPT